jgi:hypothetical protein
VDLPDIQPSIHRRRCPVLRYQVLLVPLYENSMTCLLEYYQVVLPKDSVDGGCTVMSAGNSGSRNANTIYTPCHKCVFPKFRQLFLTLHVHTIPAMVGRFLLLLFSVSVASAADKSHGCFDVSYKYWTLISKCSSNGKHSLSRCRCLVAKWIPKNVYARK